MKDEKGRTEAWGGFSCPRCHTLFRVPGEAVGKRVECPACGELVLVPHERGVVEGGGIPDGAGAAEGTTEQTARNRFRSSAERVAEVVDDGGWEPRGGETIAVREEVVPAGGEAGGGRKRVHKKLRKRGERLRKEFAWERGVPGRARRRQMRRLLLRWGGRVLAVLVVVGAAGSFAGWWGGKPAAGAAGPVGGPDIGAEGEHEDEDDPAISQVAMAREMEALRATIGEFLAAPSVEEMARRVRGGEGMIPLMKAFYGDGGHAPTLARKIAPTGKVQMVGDLWSVGVLLEDHSLRPIALERREEGFLVDWESWVGYCELPWAEFIARRPEEAGDFRVLCREVDYYNFSFGDDSAWRSFLLESPDREHALYGYVPRYSEQARRLARGGSRESDRPHAMILRLRFPGKGAGPNQVVIDEVITSGWIRAARKAGEPVPGGSSVPSPDPGNP